MANSSFRLHASRLFQSVLSIFVVITLTFGLVRLLPGGPMTYIRTQLLRSTSQDANIDELIEAYTNINPSKPLLEQYIDYLGTIAQGSLGQSIWFEEPVSHIIAQALPWTLLLVLVSLFLIYAIGIASGAIIAYAEGTRLDSTVSALATVLSSVPGYVLGVIFIYFLGYQWGWFPVGGKVDPNTVVGVNIPFIASVLHHMALPVAAFVISGFGFRTLTMRGNSISVLGKEFVRVAKLRGLSKRHIALRYVGKNAILPMYTGLLISIGQVLGATVIIERIFRYEGLGYYMFRAISTRDYPLMMGCFIVITTAVVMGVYIADLTYRLIDPTADGMSTNTNISVRHLRTKIERKINRLRRRLTGNAGSDNVEGTGSDNSEKIAGTQFATVADPSEEKGTGGGLYEFVVVPFKILWEDWRTRVGLSIVLLYVVVGIFGPLVVPAPVQGQAPRTVPALQSLAHPFGTDPSGRDLLSLMVYATEPMLKMIVAGGVFATTVATFVGIVAGYAGGMIDRTLMTVSDIMLAIPGIPLAIVLGVIFQPHDPILIGFLLTINAWGGTARQIRSETITVRNHSYVEASQVMGISSGRILHKEILPNIMSFILIKFVGSGRRVIFASVGLYFLGALPYTLENWGVIMKMAYDGGALLSTDLAYWLFIPMIAIVLLSYAFIMLAQGTDRLLNPRVRAKHQQAKEGHQSSNTSSVQPTSDD